MATALEDEIQAAAEGPAQVTVGGNTTKGQPIRDLIEADRHLASNAAVRSNRRGIHLTKIRASGAT